MERERNKIKNSKIGLLIVLLLAGGINYKVRAQELIADKQTKESEMNIKTFENKFFRFDYPGKWEIWDDFNETKTLVLSLTKEDSEVIYIIFQLIGEPKKTPYSNELRAIDRDC